jgi:hypothetical protein
MQISEEHELFIQYLAQTGSVIAASEACGISKSTGYKWNAKLKDVIIERAREVLTGASLKAVATTVSLMDADGSTEKGELRLAAAEKVMDRVGLTKHTSVEVKVESENGVFILPGKNAVEAPE